jgi:hypothetical protein
MTAKTRLSVTVDADLIAASQAAVAQGEAEPVSAWVNDALRLKVEHDRRLRGIDDFIAAFEAEYGEITDEEMDAAPGCEGAGDRDPRWSGCQRRAFGGRVMLVLADNSFR